MQEQLDKIKKCKTFGELKQVLELTPKIYVFILRTEIEKKIKEFI